MIVLKSQTDYIGAIVYSQLNAATAGIPFYCSWNVNGAVASTPYDRSLGTITASLFPVAPTVMIPYAAVSPGQLEVTEITICNVIPIWPPPPIGAAANTASANVIVYYVDTSGMAPIAYQLYQCVLQPGDVLSYNATPGVIPNANGTWSIFDARGQRVLV